MVLLVVVFLLLGVLVGAVAHLPLPVSLFAGTVIGGWLTAFLARERRAERREEGPHAADHLRHG